MTGTDQRITTTKPSVTSGQIVELLLEATPATVEEAQAAVPEEPGFYSWWAGAGALSQIPKQAHPRHRVELLYVGIAPSRPSSSRSLRTRICGQHIGGNIGSSTFRFGLAALLWQRMGWVPQSSASGKVRLSPQANKKLSEWQSENLRVAWAVVDKPWCYEREVIELMRSPMNREFNESHPFYTSMGTARTKLRQAAKPV